MNKEKKEKGLPAQFYDIYKKYGIDFAIYNKMFKEQEGCCGICKRHQSEFDSRLVVDHNHETGKVRGLLCFQCNTALGLLKENKQSVMNMVIYIQLQNES